VTRHIVVLSNDIVPGMGLPVAAPGLRAWGIAQGLRAHGFRVSLIVDAHVVARAWGQPFPPPRRGCIVLTPRQAGDFVRCHRPDALIVTNSNHVEALGSLPGIRLIYDFFAPKVLELEQFPAGPERDLQMQRLVERKLQALARAEAILVNGQKKSGYVQSWLRRAGAEHTPTRVVLMPIPSLRPSQTPTAGPIHAVVSGYLQPWSQPGEWADTVAPYLQDGSLVLHLMVSNHWSSGSSGLQLPEMFRRLAAGPGVQTHGMMEFEPFQRLLNSCHVSIDLFSRNPERELAMVTRTMVAVSAGLATIHVPFTESSELVREHGAGWLVDPDDHDGISTALTQAVGDRDCLRVKREGARALAAVMEPERAVLPILDLVGEGAA
jgi:hypothetical protein